MKSYNWFPNFRQEVLKIAQREINELTDSSIFQDYADFPFNLSYNKLYNHDN